MGVRCEQTGHPLPRGTAPRTWLALLAGALVTACAAAPSAHLPRAGEGADTVIILQSNQQKTEFLVDGAPVGRGKRLRVLINQQPHTITARPEGYREKEDFIQPPFHAQTIIGFTFLIGDRLQEAQAQDEGLPHGRILGNEGTLVTVVEYGEAHLGDGTKEQVKEKAKLVALRKAVELAGGMQVSSSSVMKNFELTEDRVVSSSDAYVRSVRELTYAYDPGTETGRYEGEFVIDVSRLEP